MAGDTDNPRIWVNADVFVAPVGTTPPVDVAAAWPNGWEPIGLLSEDGMGEASEMETTHHRAYGGIHVRTSKSREVRTMTVTALENNPIVHALVNPGSDVDHNGGVTTRKVRSRTLPDPRAFGLELRDGDIVNRRVIYRGEVTNVGDISIVDNSLHMFELTITLYQNDDGWYYADITNDPQAVPAGS